MASRFRRPDLDGRSGAGAPINGSPTFAKILRRSSTGCAPESQVRSGLPAGGRRIRTLGSSRRNRPLSRQRQLPERSNGAASKALSLCGEPRGFESLSRTGRIPEGLPELITVALAIGVTGFFLIITPIPVVRILPRVRRGRAPGESRARPGGAGKSGQTRSTSGSAAIGASSDPRSVKRGSPPARSP
jgi:hypothetical protein